MLHAGLGICSQAKLLVFVSVTGKEQEKRRMSSQLLICAEDLQEWGHPGVTQGERTGN